MTNARPQRGSLRDRAERDEQGAVLVPTVRGYDSRRIRTLRRSHSRKDVYRILWPGALQLARACDYRVTLKVILM